LPTAQRVGFYFFSHPPQFLPLPVKSLILTQVHPILFHIGSLLIPSYGAVTALGVLVALVLAQRAARIVRVDAGKVWNLCILSLFAALAATRLLLVAANWSVLRSHPAWVLGLGMVHHPLLACAGALAGAGCAAWYVRHSKLPFRATADALAPPLAAGLAFEQLGAFAAGSGYGIDAAPSLGWAVIYTNPFAAIGAVLRLAFRCIPCRLTRRSHSSLWRSCCGSGCLLSAAAAMWQAFG